MQLCTYTHRKKFNGKRDSQIYTDKLQTVQKLSTNTLTHPVKIAKLANSSTNKLTNEYLLDVKKKNHYNKNCKIGWRQTIISKF